MPDEVESIERASRDELAALQLARLRAILSHAYANVPLYRSRFDAAGVHPSDLRHLGDISMFPFTVKADLREHYPFAMLAVPREGSREFTRHQARPDGPRSSDTRRPTSTCGRSSLPVPCAPPECDVETSCTSRTGTACSPAGLARTTAPSEWDAP